MNVARFVANFLIEKKVKHVFGYQGGAILKLVDEFVGTGQIEFIQNYHEQASAFGADAYSRISGEIGVALATSGPGATNLITGIVNANLDSIPTLFITGQDYTANITKQNGSRQNGFQDLDIAKIVAPVTKYSTLVTDPDSIKYELEKAYFYATSGRPGATLLDIPIDVQFAEIDEHNLVGFNAPIEERDTDFQFEKVKEALEASARPLVLVGGGVRLANSVELVRRFCSKTNIPVITTLNGLDVFEGNFGFAGLYGNTAANMAAQNADLILVFGAKLGQRQVGKNPEKYTEAKIIHIDIDEAELGRVFANEIAIQSHLSDFLSNLLEKLHLIQMKQLDEWVGKIELWRKKYHVNAKLNEVGLDPVDVVERVSQYFNVDTIITNDVGQNQMWVSQAFKVRGNQRLLNSVGLGSMGYSLPAAIASKILNPEKQVICFTGDGGLQINIQELMLVSQKKIGVKCIVFNNKTMGMIREVQIRYYDGNYYGANEDEFSCVDLKKLANAYNLSYAKVDEISDISKLENLLTNDEPCVIEVSIDIDSKLTNRYDESQYFELEKI